MNQTPNYKLNQWVKDDQVRMEDFNADNSKIDAAIKAVDQRADSLSIQKADASALNALQTVVNDKGNCRIATGSYTGTGEYGQAHPNTLTFPFKPKVVLIAQWSAGNADGYMIAVQGQINCCSFNTNGGGHNICTWSGNSFTWYSTTNDGVQFNCGKYFYVAFG